MFELTNDAREVVQRLSPGPGKPKPPYDQPDQYEPGQVHQQRRHDVGLESTGLLETLHLHVEVKLAKGDGQAVGLDDAGVETPEFPGLPDTA